ncbi:Protein prenyltransferase alpha subunit repeat family protein [Leishmania donovani]|uniref:Geranylgeranyl transferase type-2 subunit alpha n=1 Tax=Leishmania donovani TaxID=5661 RepID=A0A504XYY8_LEIDO|nr:Protein prenyltransferase alpha subunit repeat family protein [Leishmania donovani]TPP55586.1 Protein prenyltransferase alpha subunit repeat family protein [Leishmania donovani]
MHDQKKKEKQVLSPEAKEAAARENERVGALYKSVLASSKAHEYNSTTLAKTEELLLAVPEAYTVYNCRRLALEAVASMQPCADSSGSAAETSSDAAEATPAASRQQCLVQELKFNSKVLLLNYKNYNAFLHRHWIFDQLEALAKLEMQQATGHAAGAAANATAPGTYELLCSLLRKERAQCEQLLQMDERNFHAWNYRRWVLAQELRATQLAEAHRPAHSPFASAEDATRPSTSSTPSSAFFSAEETAELAYTTHKIKSNFSNYSAWHQRSLAIKSAQAWQAALLAQLREDIEFLKQAVYCDPNDQSAWFYAPFVFQLLRRQYHYEDEDGVAAALEESFMNAVIELVADVDRVCTEDECYMPHYFLLDQLVTLQAASQGTALPTTAVFAVPGTRSSASLKRHITALCGKVPSLLACANGEVAGDGDLTNARRRCFRYLHTRLWKVDTLRRCLYDDLFQRALEGCHS